MSTTTASAAVNTLTPTETAKIVRSGFNDGITRPLEWRRGQLEALLRLVTENSSEFETALGSDLGKPALEAYSTEISGVRGEIAHVLENLEAWTTPKEVPVPITLEPATARIVREPLGAVLIISPWNYPVYLLFMPLIAAIAAGNAVVMKPSELAPATSAVIARLAGQYLDQRVIRVVEGAVDETTELLSLRWDHIFYTGNSVVGRIVMAAAAKNLTPVTLELGGKSPVWVDPSADLDAAANWITWGKFLNAGQTCIAPDYVMTTPDVAPRLVTAIHSEITSMYGDDPRQSPDFARVINTRHLARLTSLLAGSTIAIGGDSDADDRYLAPTVLTGVKTSDPVMDAEIFGPILPILEVPDYNEAIDIINDGEKPLALYVFTSDIEVENEFLQRTSSGSFVVNTALLQISAPDLPFGGVGESGMGAYRGEQGIRTLSHERSCLHKGETDRMILSFGQPPYTAEKDQVVRSM